MGKRDQKAKKEKFHRIITANRERRKRLTNTLLSLRQK